MSGFDDAALATARLAVLRAAPHGASLMARSLSEATSFETWPRCCTWAWSMRSMAVRRRSCKPCRRAGVERSALVMSRPIELDALWLAASPSMPKATADELRQALKPCRRTAAWRACWSRAAWRARAAGRIDSPLNWHARAAASRSRPGLQSDLALGAIRHCTSKLDLAIIRALVIACAAVRPPFAAMVAAVRAGLGDSRNSCPPRAFVSGELSMERRSFLNVSGIAVGSLLLPVFGRAVAAEELFEPLAVKFKEDAGRHRAERCDGGRRQLLRCAHWPLPEPVHHHPRPERRERGQHRVGRHRRARHRQRRLRLRRHLRHVARCDGIANAARQAVAIAKANAKLQSEPVRLAPVRGVGDVSWATPIKKDWRSGADQGKGRPADRRQQGRHGWRRDLHEFDAVPGEPSRSTSLPPTVPTSSRTSTACGRRCPGHRRG